MRKGRGVAGPAVFRPAPAGVWVRLVEGSRSPYEAPLTLLCPAVIWSSPGDLGPKCPLESGCPQHFQKRGRSRRSDSC